MADREREMSFYNYLTRLDHRAELAMDSVTAGIFSCKIGRVSLRTAVLYDEPALPSPPPIICWFAYMTN